MNPKKSRELIVDVSRDTGLPIAVVEAITKMYWREVWENVTSLSAPKVHIENLGDFNIKHWLLDREIQRCEMYEQKVNKRKYLSGLSVSEKKDLLYNIKNEVEEENQRKEFIYEHKKITSEDSKDLEE